MAIANCSECKGEINTESSPSGKCVRCTEGKAPASRSPAPPATPKAGSFGNPSHQAETKHDDSAAALAAAKKEAAGEDDDNPFAADPHSRGEHAGKKSHR